MLLLGAPKTGVTVEIGSFKGKSTVGLAALSRRYGLGKVVSIDPHNAPSVTDPELGNQPSSFSDFIAGLSKAGVEQEVEVHRTSSKDASLGWDRPIRFLWIDGDHTYPGAKLDFDLFSPYLVEGAIIGMHDTLHEFERPFGYSSKTWSDRTNSAHRVFCIPLAGPSTALSTGLSSGRDASASADKPGG